MKRILQLYFTLSLVLLGCKPSSEKKSEQLPIAGDENENARPTVSFTFDDGSTSDIAGFAFKDWNQMILSHLEKEDLNAVFFVTGVNKRDEKGTFLLKSWNDKGHNIANHTFSHPNFNAETNSSELFEWELLQTDSIISKFGNSIRLFRFPYLKEGQHPAKVDSIRNVLAKHNYSNGYVTIDASDWYVNHRLINRIKEVGLEHTDLDKFRDFYVAHILDRADYYEKLSYEINQRHIDHTLLLHHNLTSALFLGDLITAFKKKGWAVVDAESAFQDKIFQEVPGPEFAGESLIYSLAKQTGKYDQILRYPAEDSRYEKDRMDELGL